MAKRRRELSPAEVELWRSVLRDTVPLPGRSLPLLPPEPETVPPVELDTPPPKRSRQRAAKRTPPAAPGPTPLELGGTVGMDRRQAARLKRGRTAIDARIDLHGMTQAEAHRRLDAFIEASAAAGRRCVLVITGKGLTSEMSGRGSGVLREAVPRWLSEPGLRRHIIAVTHAAPKDGGHGALYVLLRRAKG